MITAFKYFNRADALLAVLRSATADWIVEIIDPAQSGRAVVERIRFEHWQKAKAQRYIKKQIAIDHWNRYELVRASSDNS